MSDEQPTALDAPAHPPVARIARFDFTARRTALIGETEIAAALAAGQFLWFDIDCGDVAAVRAFIRTHALVDERLQEDLLAGDPGTRLTRHRDALHLLLCGCRLRAEAGLALEPVDVVATERLLITLHDGPREFLRQVEREYEEDFVRFARSPSFLLYEIWDALTDHYVATQKRLERSVQQLQQELIGDVDDRVFVRVSEVGRNLLEFRSLLVPTRSVLHELATRRSLVVSEPTQAALANMAGTVERVLQDVMVDRDILAQGLNLHMSMVSHRTNRAMSRLTVISTVFLPLTFVCGIYGMNFEYMPELGWRWGYAFFWLLTFLVAGGLLWAMRRAGLL